MCVCVCVCCGGFGGGEEKVEEEERGKLSDAMMCYANAMLCYASANANIMLSYAMLGHDVQC